MIDIVFSTQFFYIYLTTPSYFLGAVESAKKYKCTPEQALNPLQDSGIGGTCVWLIVSDNLVAFLDLLWSRHLSGHFDRCGVTF